MGNSIFNQYIEKRNVITKNKKVLQTTYVPNVLPHRVEQIDSIASIISIALNGEKPSNILSSSFFYFGLYTPRVYDKMVKSINR